MVIIENLGAFQETISGSIDSLMSSDDLEINSAYKDNGNSRIALRLGSANHGGSIAFMNPEEAKRVVKYLNDVIDQVENEQSA